MKTFSKPGEPKPLHDFEILFKEDGKYYFQARVPDEEPFLFGKSSYSSEKSCKSGIEAIIRAAKDGQQYELHETQKGKYYFILKSGNHREIGRSRIFETTDDAEKYMDLLQRSGEEDIAKEKKREKRPEVTEKAQKEKAPQPQEREKMPRYKFSVIYYPDSQIWMVKNDFSGASTNMDTCNGLKIEDFITAQLPAEEQKMIRNKKTAEVPPKAVPAKAKQTVVSGETDIIIKSHQGEMIKRYSTLGKIGKAELVPKGETAAISGQLDAKVVARSLENNQTTIIGFVRKKQLVNGRLEVPLFGANGLSKGKYRIIANINHIDEKGADLPLFTGSELIMLN